jgi:hypothetical protein
MRFRDIAVRRPPALLAETSWHGYGRQIGGLVWDNYSRTSWFAPRRRRITDLNTQLSQRVLAGGFTTTDDYQYRV